MIALLRYWLELCLLRAAPQDGPASGFIVGIAISCYAMVSVLVSTASYGMLTGARLAVAELLLLVAFVALLLYLRGKLARFNQTLSAMAGAGALLGLIALPLVMLVDQEASGNPPAAMLAIAWLGLLFWNLVVSAHIIRHALSTNFAIGFAVSLVYMLLSTQLVLILFPQLADTVPAG